MNKEKIRELEKIIEEKYANTAGIVVQKNKKVLYEKYFNGCGAYNAVHAASVTKSVFSALVGIALQKGCIKSIEQKVLEFFPEYIERTGSKTAERITLRNMLTMTAPYRCETEPYEEFFMSGNWMDFALGLLGGDGKIGEFRYSPIVGVHILSGILVKATGQPVLDFAAENLFLPLGINVNQNLWLRDKDEYIAAMNGKNSVGWAVDPQGINPAGWGLFLTALEMAKIGQLYLNNGLWEGKQVLAKDWISESTKTQSRWGGESGRGELSYGFLWWVLDEDEGCFAALGDGGNTIYVNRREDTVISAAALFRPDAPDRIELIKGYIEPLFLGRVL